MSVVPAEPQPSEPAAPEPVPPEPAPPAPADRESLLDARIGAALIDLALLSVLFILISATLGKASVGGGSFSFYLDDAADSVLFFALVLGYYFALEATIGQTVGKLLVGLRVVGRDEGRPSVAAAAIRTLLRVVDWLPLLYLAGLITIVATRDREQRLGDLAAKTGIAKAAPIRHRGLAVAAVASALVLVLAGSVAYVAASDEDGGAKIATSDEDGGAKTYRGHGVSFDYPTGWFETNPQIGQAVGPDPEWKAAVAAADRDLVIVTAYRLNQRVTAEDVHAGKSEFSGIVQQLAEQSGGTILAGPEEISVAGKPGLAYRMTATTDGTPIESRLVFVFDGTTEYQLNCQHTAEKTEEIAQGCEQILRTFSID